MSIRSVQDSTQNLGWLVVMPDGYRYAWYSRGDHATAREAFEAFEPDQAQRAALMARGWSVQAGDAVDILPDGGLVHRVSA